MHIFFIITVGMRYFSLRFIERLGDLPTVTQLEKDISTTIAQICQML